LSSDALAFTNLPGIVPVDVAAPDNKLCVIYDKNKQKAVLFSHLDAVLNLARKKMDMVTTSESNKQKWTRILVSAVDSWGNLLRGVEIEARVLDLEKEQKITVEVVDSVRWREREQAQKGEASAET